MKTILFWDIDGTLLSTGRAGIFAWEDAALEVAGKKVDLDKLKTAGLTDIQVAVRILESCEADVSPDTVLRLVRSYERRLPGSLPRKKGGLLPNVKEILESVRSRTDAVSLLLTGNTRAGAKAKLAYYGIDDFFEDGAFSDDTTDRPAIARAALALASKSHGSVPPESLYVIGDTPHDVECAKAIQARCIAVATGGYSADQLRPHAPWWLLERLPEPGEFFRKIGLP